MLLDRMLNHLESLIDRQAQFPELTHQDDKGFYGRFQDKLICEAVGVSHTEWNKIRKGHRRATDEQLQRVAHYYKLDVCVPDPASLLRLGDYQAFVLRVANSGYGMRTRRSSDPLFPALEFLLDLHALGLERGGIEIERKRDRDKDTSRAAASELPSFLSADIFEQLRGELYRLRVGFKRPGALALLEVVSGISRPPGYLVRVLAPSFRHPRIRYTAGTIIPDDTGGGSKFLEVGDHLGRVDLIALVVDEAHYPPLLTEKLAAGTFAVLAADEEAMFLAALRAAPPNAFRLGHRAIRIS